MAVKQYKPTSNARRGMTSQDFSKITKKKPTKSLLVKKKSTAGRNNQGRITSRRRGAGVKNFYRLVTFGLPAGVKATVESIEYDPNRSARIALVKEDSGKLHYILASTRTYVGQKIESGEEAPIEPGNRMTLKTIPTGSTVYNIELTVGKGGQMVRSAGTRAQLTAKEGDYGLIRLPSGEIRKVNLKCTATIGSIGNEQHQNIKYGKAGRRRKMGRRPSVRGVVMNAADHPHGGGDGGSHGPGRDPKTPWGQLTLGYKTRRRKDSDAFIVRSRHQAKRKR